MAPLITMVHPCLNLRGGAERKLLIVSRGLMEAGFDVEIVVREFSPSSTFTELLREDLRILTLESRTTFRWWIKVLSHLRRARPALIVAHNYPANVPVAIAGMLAPRARTAWICNEVATLLIRRQSLSWRAYYKIEQLLARRFDLIVANSSFTATNIEQYYRITPRVIRSGVEVRLNAQGDGVRNELRALSNVGYILVLSRLEVHKNIALLPRLAEGVFPRTVLLAGGGPEEATIRSLCQTHANLVYVGQVSEDEKHFLYRYASVFAFLPLEEPLGVTVMEALVHNVPVVAFNRGGPSEVVLHGRNGLLVENDKEFTAGVTTFADENYRVPATLGLEYIEREFSNQRMVRDFVKNLGEMIDAN